MSDPLEAEALEGRRQLIVLVAEDGDLEIEGDAFACWELIGLGAFIPSSRRGRTTRGRR